MRTSKGKSSSRNRGRHLPEPPKPTDETERLPALVVAVRRVRIRLGLPEAEAAEGALAAAAVEGLAAGERRSQAAGPLTLAGGATTSRLQSCSEPRYRGYRMRRRRDIDGNFLF